VYACEGTQWAGEHTTELFDVRGVATGDLDGDGVDDAVVAIAEHYYGCGNNGSYNTTHLMAFATGGLLAKTITGGRPLEVSIDHGRIELRLARGTEHWQLAGGKLVRN
jgi:hypothetical protein